MKKNCLLCAVCARKVKKKVLNEEKYLPKQILFHLPMKVSNYIFLSLLSDSNQRPRDYKSRALAN